MKISIHLVRVQKPMIDTTEKISDMWAFHNKYQYSHEFKTINTKSEIIIKISEKDNNTFI